MVIQANRQLCKATRKDGHPCHAPAIRDGLCFGHSPALAEKASQARITGGKNRAKSERLRRLVPPRLIPLFDKLENALDEVHDGELEPRIASAMAALAGAMVRVLTSGELEERVRKLEEIKK